MKLEVGQKLWFVPTFRRGYSGYEVTITKVGRKWACLSNHERMDINTLIIDSGNYIASGEIFESKDKFLETVAMAEEWEKFVYKIANSKRPDHITIEALKNIRKIIYNEKQ